MPNAKLDSLNEAFGTFKKEFETLRAEMSAPPQEEMCSKSDAWGMMDRMMGFVYGMVDNLHAKINEVDDSHWAAKSEHQKGHFPPFKTATHLQNFLKAAGMDKDFDVVKPVIYASTNPRVEIMADYAQFKK